jgi:thiol-disulfide isomerase/thioredoxin
VRNLTFYTTAGCHLCALAADLISQLESTWDVSVVEIDIVTDEKLADRYGTRIPVVSRCDTQRELSWPFTLEELECFAAP